MRKREILKNNKLIAEFMGHYHSKKGFLHFKEGFSNSYVENNLQDIKYHSSWDWLMPVVIKIGKVHYGPEREFLISSSLKIINDVSVSVFHNGFAPFNIMNTLEDVYKGVVEYIKWYNKNHEKK
ncbi:MAG: hypothetical protein WC346_22385 [Methanogenium sp.]|jgi:hypothetical protein